MEPLATLEQQVDVVGKGGEGGKTATKTRNEQCARRGRQRPSTLGQTKQKANQKTTNNIYCKSSQGKASQVDVVAQATCEKS